MKILMLAWEYPPRSVGGISSHVYDLSHHMAKMGHTVYVMTCNDNTLKEFEEDDGVYVYRVCPYNIATNNFIDWVFHLNMAALERAAQLLNDGLDIDIIHVHDWLMAFCGRALKHIYAKPLIATIHASEYGRNNGLHSDMQRYISDVEWWLTYEAWRVICCSNYMKDELRFVFQLPEDKIRILPNGVDIEQLSADGDISDFRLRYAAPGQRIICFVGRLVREKGVDTLIAAAPAVLSKHPDVKFVIAGNGPYEDVLRRMTWDRGLYEKVQFAGYVDKQTRNKLYKASDIAVFPSLYEPFGIVALEAMAARVPVVVSDVGGLSEIVVDGIDGYKVPPGNAQALADGILSLLDNPSMASRMCQKAFYKVQQAYNWDMIASATIKVYTEVLHGNELADHRNGRSAKTPISSLQRGYI
ncbi:glycosyltransferase family 4 protein [Mahella sp.]|jgi:glycogen(starch) synthase|uniref:glycosyltransferase family 4 protein n=1 Tax=Mahella sp. TaxID=2798721 RepID=UPI0025C08EC5|nr:glycosyltransferase family 4 protein [Mahella sp.]MBZ4666743.1 glycosyl transferase group 1 [Mahella sp.]